MSSEEMRVELESFVNQGLQEGWVGWPAKSELTGICMWSGRGRLGSQASAAGGGGPASGLSSESCNGCRLGGVYTA